MMLTFVLGSLLSLGTVAWAGPPRVPTLGRCERALQAAPERRESWACFYDHARSRGDWTATAASLRTHLLAFEATNPGPLQLGYAHLALANVVAELDTDEGIALYEQAADELRRGDDPLALTLTLLNLAFHQRVAGDPSLGAATLRRAERAAVRYGDPQWIATVEVEQVRHMLRTGGDLGRAARLLAASEPLLFPSGDHQAQVTWLAAAISVYRGLGQLARARVLVDRQVELVARAQDRYAEASIRYNRLGIRLDQAIEDGALAPSAELLAEIDEAVAIAKAGNNRWAALSLRTLQADLLLIDGSGQAAEALARHCLIDARELGDARLEIDAMLALVESIAYGGLPLDEERRAELEGLLATARARARETDDAFTELYVIGTQATLLWHQHARARAIAASEAQLELLERMRAEQHDPTTRAEFQGAQANAFERYIDQLLREAQAVPEDREQLIAKAFAVGERFRARVLRESLAASGASQLSDPAVLARISAIQLRLRDPSLEAEDRAEALDELEALERRELEALAESAEPAWLAAEPSSLADLQRALQPREALLIVHLPKLRELLPARRSRAWVLVITAQQVEAVELEEPRQIWARAAMLGPLIERRELELEAATRKLGALLLDDVLAAVPASVDTLGVVLDGPLHRLPLASLRVGPQGQPLVERFAVSAVPSASLLVSWRRRRVGQPRALVEPGVLALADPPTPFAALGPADLDHDRERTLSEGLALPPLPLARREAELAARLARDTVWIGAQASETALDQLALDRFAVLHFATHAVIDELHPGRSAIVLAPAGGDGLLQPREIAGLDLEGKLVVLSACSTARGRVVAAEGVMGLAHAMFGAGAHTVVASLWPLRDDDALALFERFYPYLDAGDDVATALRRAQRDRAEQGAPPAAWAGVVVLGDPSLVPFPEGRADAADPTATAASTATAARYEAIALGSLLLACALGLGYAARRRG